MGQDRNGKALPRGIRQRPDGLYEGRSKLQGENISVYEDSPKKALEKLEEVKYQIRHGIYCRPNEETVNSWFKIWMETYKEPAVKKSTIQTYRQAYDEFIGAAFGKRKIGDIKPQMIQRFINDLYSHVLPDTKAEEMKK
ncbi:MAG: hypothetical protein LUG27_07105 [Clostridiales bacterium]|nr:hypothetical protein [Clostridiales bacterium]